MKYDAIIFDLEGTLVNTVKKGELLIDRKDLIKLSKKYELTIVTSESKKSTKALLLRLDMMTKIFKLEKIVTPDDCPRKKPNPEPLLLAKKLIKARNPIFIGDSYKDRQAAERAGIDFISINDREARRKIGFKFKNIR